MEAAYGIRFLWQGERPRLPILGDEDRLVQILTNLLSNAAKYSDRGQAVEIRLALAAPWARASVLNRGPEIPSEFRERIFQKFSQADASDTRLRGGTGLGLSISKALVERMGGRIQFESGPEATIFHVELPLLP